jgi:hypothetical protein
MDLFQLREQFSRDGILMCFNGPFSHSIIEEIGIAIRNHLAAENIARMAVQDVFAIYIEMTQNARNYLTRKNNSYAVTSGNVVLKEDIEQLRSRIDHINALEPDELKKLIRQQLRAEVPAGATGAGIGLMEMAKRASNRLEYSVRDIDGGHSFFTLTAQI